MDFLFDWILNAILNIVGQCDDAKAVTLKRDASLYAGP